MGWLYLPKIEPTAGQKGFTCGDVFVPIETEAPSAYKKGICIELDEKDSAPTSGLVFHLSGETDSLIAETGQEMSGYGDFSNQEKDGFRAWYSPGGALIYCNDNEMPSGNNPWTISVFAKSVNDNSSGAPVFGFGNTSSSGRCAFFELTGSSRVACWIGGNSNVISDTNSISHKEWNLLTATFDGTTLIIYLNGDEVKRGTPSMNIVHNGDYGIQILGVHNVTTRFRGWVRDARIYNRALSPKEVKSILGETKKAFIPLEEVQPVEGAEYEKSSEEMPSGGLILHVPLEQSATVDELENEITETGNVTFTTVEGIQCAQFDGDSYIQFIVDLEKALSGSSTNVPFTATMWVYAQPSQYNSNTRGVFQYSTDVPENSNKTGISIDTSTDGKIFGVDITDGFHFVAVTRDSTGTIKCYLDGVQVDASIDSLRTPDSSGYIGRVVFQEIMTEG